MQWREGWSSASVVSHTIVTDPTIRQPGFNLPHHTRSLINCFRTGQGTCHAKLHKWGLAQSPSCDCGQRQTMNHIVDTCPLTKLEDGLNLHHEVDDDTVIRLESTVTAALTKYTIRDIQHGLHHFLQPECHSSKQLTVQSTQITMKHDLQTHSV